MSCLVRFRGCLACPVGCCFIICICAGAHGDPTKLSYFDQSKQIRDSRKQHNINTESWRMAGDNYFLCKVQFIEQPFMMNFSRIISHGVVSRNNLTIAIAVEISVGVTFDGCDFILYVPWQDIIHYMHIVMLLASPLTNRVHGAQSSDLDMIRNTLTTFSGSLRPNTLLTRAPHCNCLRHIRNVCAMFIGPYALLLNHHQFKSEAECLPSTQRSKDVSSQV